MSVTEVHCVALGISAGTLASANSIPTGISKLFNIWKACSTVFRAVARTGEEV